MEAFSLFGPQLSSDTSEVVSDTSDCTTSSSSTRSSSLASGRQAWQDDDDETWSSRSHADMNASVTSLGGAFALDSGNESELDVGAVSDFATRRVDISECASEETTEEEEASLPAPRRVDRPTRASDASVGVVGLKTHTQTHATLHTRVFPVGTTSMWAPACPYRKYGCTSQNTPEHLRVATEHHLNLVVKAFEQRSTTMSLAQSRSRAAQAQIEKLTLRNAQLVRLLEEHNIAVPDEPAFSLPQPRGWRQVLPGHHVGIRGLTCAMPVSPALVAMHSSDPGIQIVQSLLKGVPTQWNRLSAGASSGTRRGERTSSRNGNHLVSSMMFGDDSSVPSPATRRQQHEMSRKKRVPARSPLSPSSSSSSLSSSSSSDESTSSDSDYSDSEDTESEEVLLSPLPGQHPNAVPQKRYLSSAVLPMRAVSSTLLGLLKQQQQERSRTCASTTSATAAEYKELLHSSTPPTSPALRSIAGPDAPPAAPFVVSVPATPETEVVKARNAYLRCPPDNPAELKRLEMAYRAAFERSQAP